jgi:hypothetical protein
MKVSGILLFILILSGFSGPRCAATVYHSNGSAANVQQIHNNQAHNGDTITVPAGTFSWSARVNLTKAIILKGATTCNSATGVCNDQTIIQDNISRRLNQGLIELRGNAGQRITGLTFRAGLTGTGYNGMIRVEAGTTPVRIDHCHFNGTYWSPQIGVFSKNWGVLDHNVMDNSRFTLGGFVHFWPGARTDLGDSLWETSAGFGGPNFLFLENNWLEGGSDITVGGKICARYNKFFGNNNLGSHGTARTFRNGRGGRAEEAYNNVFNYTNNYSSLDGPDAGSCIYHHNVVVPHTYGISMRVYRSIYSYGSPFYGADGANAWDYNVTEADGTHVDGHPPYLFDSGTLSFTSGSTLTDLTKNWSPTNKWVGYSVRRPSDGATALITGSTGNTLTIAQWISQGWAPGNGYNIRKVLRTLDQVGLGAGAHINRISPAWPNQSSEPCYSWDNTNPDDGSSFGFTVGAGGITILAGRDYFNNTPMPGYTPYTYPHPLVTGVVRAVIADFNGDGSPDYVLQRNGTGETAIWHLDNNVLIDGDFGPTLPNNWNLTGAADFNRDGHTDYALFSPDTGQTAIWYLSGPTLIGGALGPTVPSGWELVGAADFNGDGNPDYVLYKASTHQTAIWYLNNNVLIGGDVGPTLPSGWTLIGVADFDRDGHADYLLFYPNTGQTAIWYLSGPTLIGGAWGPTIPSGWVLVATGDFNGDSNPDYLLYNASTHETAIWYLNNNVFVSSAPGPTLPAAWGWLAP